MNVRFVEPVLKPRWIINVQIVMELLKSDQ
jgi:hypothetical protein